MARVDTKPAEKTADSASTNHFSTRLAHLQDQAKDGLAAVKHDLNEVRQTAHNIRVRGSVRLFLQKIGVIGHEKKAAAMTPEQAVGSTNPEGGQSLAKGSTQPKKARPERKADENEPEQASH